MEQRCLLVPLGPSTFGVPLQQLLGVEPVTRIVPLPHVPSWVLGVTHRQGQVLSVVDLTALLGLPAGPAPAAGGRLLIAADGDLTVAFAVPEVSEVRSIDPDRVEPPTGGDAVSRFLTGIVSEGEQALGLLDLMQVLRSPELRATT